MSAGNLHVEARDRDIIVTMPGTSFRVVIRHGDFTREVPFAITKAEATRPALTSAAAQRRCERR